MGSAGLDPAEAGRAADPRRGPRRRLRRRRPLGAHAAQPRAGGSGAPAAAEVGRGPRYFRLQVPLEDSIGLDDASHDALHRRLPDAAAELIASRSEELDQIADRLHRRRRASRGPAMSEVTLIVVPYELSRHRDGVGRGPEHLLGHGAAEALAEDGSAVETRLIELDGEFSDEIEACFELIRRVSVEVGEAVRRGAFPVVLSGSCFAAIGVVAGLAEESPGVLWFDAHGDFNEPNSAVHGYFDGMGLAVLTGSAWQGLLAGMEGSRVVPETAVVLAGARDLDPPEAVRLDASSIAHPTAAEIASPDALLEALAGMSPTPTGLYVHVDLDVLDIEEAHVNVYSAPGGLTGDQLAGLVECVMDAHPVRALSLTAYDPQCDSAGAVPPIALQASRGGSRPGPA